MKIAVIAPPYPLEEAPAPPLGVTYVAAAFAAAGAEVKILDYIVNRYTPEKLKAELDAFRPDAVGATSVTLNFYGAADIVRTAKRHQPDIVAIMGGPHVSFDAENTLKAYPEIDLIVRGEGERTIAELTPRLHDRRDWDAIRGLTFRRNGELVRTEDREFIEDLDTLPLPARHLLPLSRYQALGYPISIITSRGCPYSCIFCQGRRMVGKKIRKRSASLIVDEIEHILSYGINRINVADDLFASDSTKVKEVCGEIQERGLSFTWSAFARVNTVNRETLQIMKETGCDSVSFGVESGNPEMLKRIRKNITLDQVRQAVRLCNDVGMIAHTSFIVGLPGETMETLEETKRFAGTLGSLYGYHFLSPFPGTTVREEVDRYDLEILTHDWSRYDANSAIVRTSALSPEQINAFVAAYDREINECWEKQVRGYREKTNTPYEDLQVEGYFKTRFVYRLLSEDLIEKLGTLPFAGAVPAQSREGQAQDSAEAIDRLCRRLEEATDSDPALISKTLRLFIDRGYIKARQEGQSLVWHWTHNNKADSSKLA
jgi:anaerobic magnesium-protoporphyrin IX monomethyl ester cyclase